MKINVWINGIKVFKALSTDHDIICIRPKQNTQKYLKKKKLKNVVQSNFPHCTLSYGIVKA